MDSHTLTELEANGYLVLDDAETETHVERLQYMRHVLEEHKYAVLGKEITDFLELHGLE